MWSALAALALAWSVSEPASLLESRPLNLPPLVLADAAVNFDIYDVRAELAQPVTPEEKSPRTIFRLRRHLGLAGGYDQGVLHGSLGLYVTVAEIGRWNIGTTSPGIGLSRHHVLDRYRGVAVAKTDMTILISVASVHYRGGYLPSLRQLWYLNFEQVFDTRTNISGSQVGISFSSR